MHFQLSKIQENLISYGEILSSCLIYEYVEGISRDQFFYGAQ